MMTTPDTPPLQDPHRKPEDIVSAELETNRFSEVSPSSDPMDEIDIEELEIDLRNPGTLPEFRNLLALTLGTTDEDAINAAEECFVGRFPSAHAFIVQRIREHLPDFLQWIGHCLDPESTRAHYEGESLILWTIALRADDVLVFESLRGRGRTAFTIPDETGARMTVFGGTV